MTSFKTIPILFVNEKNEKSLMGYKKKWSDNSDERVAEYLDRVSEIVKPLFQNNGRVDISRLDGKGDLGYLLALILNCKFASSDDKRGRSFGADDVIAIQLEIVNNKFLKYWGKINWLSKPDDHECHRSYQDPFYGEFKSENNRLEVVKVLFGDYDKTDLDGLYWLETEMNWMYDLYNTDEQQ